MKNQIKISLNIACFNAENYLHKCLNSLVAQSLEGIEINCIDNNSSDGTVEIIQSYQKKYKNINLFRHIENTSLSGSRKTAAMVSNGEFIMMIDSDDSLLPDTCSILYETIIDQRVDVVEFDCNKVNINNQILDPNIKYCNITEGFLTQPMIIGNMIQNKLGQMTWNKICKTDLVKKIYLNYEETKIFHKEDVFFSSLLYSFCDTYYGLDKKLYNYTINFGGSHDIDFIGRCKTSKICKNLLYAFYSNGILNDNTCTLVKNKISGWMHMCFSIIQNENNIEMKKDYLTQFVTSWGGDIIISNNTDVYYLEITKYWISKFFFCIFHEDSLSYLNFKSLNHLQNSLNSNKEFSIEAEKLSISVKNKIKGD